MTKAELKAKAEAFLRTKSPSCCDEWYADDRQLFYMALQPFLETLGIELEYPEDPNNENL